MSVTKQVLTNEQIETFLQGTDPQQYIVAIESEYNVPEVSLIINDPTTGKRVEKHKYKPFLWFREDVTKIMYGGKRMKIIEASTKYGVKMTKLITTNAEGYEPARMANGYKYIAKCNKSYNDLISFFREGGIDLFSKEFSKLFVMFSPTEQFLIQSGKRLFKGMEEYDDLHRLQYDLETEGLFAAKHAIFQIGIRDNRGYENVIETLGDTAQEKRDSERVNIERFFSIINDIKPDVITGYNSENFDWDFLFQRADRLNIPITELAITLNRASKIKRKSSTLKLGGETEAYQQTLMWGYSILDISHAVRRAMAINSEIKSWGLKYITQYSGIAKPNRVYVPGDKINKTWADKANEYAFNNENGDWYVINQKNPLKEKYKIVTGAYIVQRYLCDDLWETEQIDNLFNQASFLIAKMLPTTFMRSSTMGTAGQWKLIMAAWSYLNGLAIPQTQEKREFTGGLSRLLQVGYARNVVKLDFAALYPKTQLTWDIFPDLDISGVMKGVLTYVVDTRDKFKFLTGTEKTLAKKLQAKLDKEKGDMTEEEITAMKAKIAEHKRMSNLYDKKQLPLKILANSWFGSYGAPYIFNWGDIDSAEETTCRGRQALRLMVRHFVEKYGFKPLVGDTDGFNFAFPDNIDDFSYVAKGSHWKTKEQAGKTLVGLDAVLAEFNENYMEGRMGLDIDDICSSTINFSRKNYANDIDGKIKLVGNSIKSKKMSVYIEEFLAKAIRMLLDGDGYSFIQHYHEYVDKIYNYQIPLVKIASKAKVKATISDYKKKSLLKNIAGNPMPKQAHMELALRDGLDLTLGDVLYYVNTGKGKSQGDLKSFYKSKMTKKQMADYITEHGHEPTNEVTVQLNCKLINPSLVEAEFEMIKELEMIKKALTKLEPNDESGKDLEARIEEINASLFTDEYNVAKYLDSFNKKVKPLLVCFSPEVRDKILLDIVKTKDKATKTTTEKLKDRVVFTKQECELISGIPFKDGDQDSYEELMTMEDKEIKFWDKVNKLPNYITQSEWDVIRADYHERLIRARIDGIQHEKDILDAIFKRLEVRDIKLVITHGELPIDVFVTADVAADNIGAYFVSRKWGVELARFDDVFKYEKEAIERDNFYISLEGKELSVDEKYEEYLNYIAERKFMTGSTENIEVVVVDVTETNDINLATELVREKAKEAVKPKTEIAKKKAAASEDEEDAEEWVEDEDGNLTRSDEVLKLDDEFDDTYAEKPEYHNEPIPQPKIEQEDEWPF